MNRDISISGSFNSRDLGGYFSQGQLIVWRKLFRAGSLSRIDQVGKKEFRDLGIKRVIDLRSGAERIAEPDPFSPTDDVELLWIPLFDKLDPVQKPANDELLKRYIEAFQIQGKAFVEVIRAISASSSPVLFHCTAGKDRTGLIAAFVLALVGVDEETIIADYALSAERITPLISLVEEKLKAKGADISDYAPMLACHPDMLRTALAWLNQHCQSVWHYMQLHGYTEADLAQLHRFLGLKEK